MMKRLPIPLVAFALAFAAWTPADAGQDAVAIVTCTADDGSIPGPSSVIPASDSTNPSVPLGGNCTPGSSSLCIACLAQLLDSGDWEFDDDIISPISLENAHAVQYTLEDD